MPVLRRSSALWAVLGVVLGIALYAVVLGLTAEEPETIGSGTFEVGVDVQPGIYWTEGRADGVCQYALGTPSPRDASLRDSNRIYLRAPALAEILPHVRVFYSEGCQPWTRLR